MVIMENQQGVNMESSNQKCRYCNAEVTWRVSKAGNRYLAVQAHIFGDDGRIIKYIYPAHQCTATPEEKAERNRQLAESKERAIQQGEIVVGQKITVVKGRKFPIGTTGVINWIAREADGYGVIKVRVVKEDGDTFYINQANIKATVLVGVGQ